MPGELPSRFAAVSDAGEDSRSAALLEGDDRHQVADPVRPRFANALLDADLAVPKGVVGPDGKPAPKRFNVYRNNVIVSLTEALAQTYPAIQNLVGEAYFAALAPVYISSHPPESAVLLDYGEGLADFLERFQPLEAYPYLGDVARLEWAWLRAYHAADVPVLDPARLAALPSDRLAECRFTLHPACHLIASRWSVFPLFLLNRQHLLPADKDPGPGQKSQMGRLDISDAETALITRPDLSVDVVRLSAPESVFAKALADGRPLGEAADMAMAEKNEFDLGTCLRTLLQAGAFAEIGY